MKRIIKGYEPPCLLQYRQINGANYDGYSPKKSLKEALLTEQGYICCYCMRRISEENMEIEHCEPQSKYPELQINYKNLLASCSGNRGSKKDNQHCNPRKGDAEITINPCDSTKNCENYIKYSSTGKIFSDDETINHELNEILNLNLQTLKDNRQTKLFTLINALNKKFPNKTWSKEAIKKKLEELSSKDAEGKYTEYVQYIVWYLSKRLNNP
jgi:uncharacterized protein (TIGR02646 family)